jgi:3-oxoacyl-(acyl-carrier-protein) synthase
MLNPVYIHAARAISAQPTFLQNELPQVLVKAQQNRLFYQHPDYSRYFSIMQLRRMSTLMKTGLAAAIECLADAGIKRPDAIITGTGRGSISETEKFIHHIQDYQEGTLNPTPFIQSTYNSLNGLIGLHHHANCYNTSFVHRGHSLELALTDAQLLFQEGNITTALVGCFEEISAEHFIMKQKLGYWKKEMVDSEKLLLSTTQGTIAGEGTCFFAMKKEPAGALAKFCGVKMLFEPDDMMVVENIHQLLAGYQLTVADIDLVFLGANGDAGCADLYNTAAALFNSETVLQGFKPACGEYDTAAGFALWLAVQVAKKRVLHSQLTIRQGSKRAFKNILIYNHFNRQQQSIYLLQQT